MTDGPIAVTGAGGYVGGRLVRSLQEAGIPTRPIVSRARPWLPADQAVVDLRGAGTGELVAALEGARAVVHLAGPSEVAAATDPAGSVAASVAVAQRTADAVLATGVPRIVYLSTVHVYGQRMTDGARLSEDLRPEPRHPYAIARLAVEHLLAATCSAGADLVVLRLTNSVGAPAHHDVDRWTLLVNDLARQGATTGRLQLHSSGAQSRDFIALSDACAAITAAAVGSVAAGTYNLGRGEPVTVRAVAEMVADAVDSVTGKRPPLDAPPTEGVTAPACTVVIERLRAQGISTPTPIEDAIAETVRFCLDHGGPS